MSSYNDHKYTLYYFDAKGRAEPIRMLFAVAGVEFEDKRVSFQDWPNFKKKTPMGQLPYMVIDDGKLELSQSRTIMRYLAKSFGLAGKTKSEAAKCDMLVDGCVDLLEKAIPWLVEADDIKKKQMYKDFSKNSLLPFMDRYERFLHKNRTGFFVGNEMTWADVMIFTILAGIEQQVGVGKLFRSHEELDVFIDKMKSDHKISKYMRKHW